jgi:hypothetical protein
MAREVHIVEDLPRGNYRDRKLWLEKYVANYYQGIEKEKVTTSELQRKKYVFVEEISWGNYRRKITAEKLC